MSNKLTIKVCGIKEPANRQVLEDLPTGLFGFVFFPPSPRYVGGMEEEELRRLTATTKEKVAVFVNEEIHTVINIAQKYRFTHVQLHGHESPAYCREIRDAGYRVIKAFHISPGFSFETPEPYLGSVGFFLFDTGSSRWGGSGRKFDWDLLDTYLLDIPFFLSGGIRPGDEEAIACFTHPAFYGIDLNSGFEDAPGVKNHEKLRSFIDKLQETRNTSQPRIGNPEAG